jgi:hypothetical protein
MTSALSRQQHLRALADDAERSADRLCSAGDYAQAEKHQKLAKSYREMAQAILPQETT